MQESILPIKPYNYSNQKILLEKIQASMASQYHVDSSNDLLQNGHFACDGLPNVVLPATMSNRLIADPSTAISLNVCLPNQPLTKRAFFANLT